jgi:ring-1,2-phenylacetyl-CoA epoxidase subunit PaaD
VVSASAQSGAPSAAGGARARPIPLASAAYVERAARRAASPDADLFAVLDAVVDPEVPVLSLWELGVLGDVRRVGRRVHVAITPTYTSCPAFEAMRDAIRAALVQAGETDVEIETCLSPAWGTDWLSPAALEKLRAHGVAPPTDAVHCPQCGSNAVGVVAEHGATACQALYRCASCGEPFPRFKPI